MQTKDLFDMAMKHADIGARALQLLVLVSVALG